MIKAHGPEYLIDQKQVNLEKCIKYINNVIEETSSTIVKIDCLNDVNLRHIYREVIDCVVNIYIRAGWSKVYLNEIYKLILEK